jgi:hypothetical protein
MEFKEWYGTHWKDEEDTVGVTIKDVQKEAYEAGYAKRKEQERKLYGRRKEDKNIKL